MSTNIKTVWDLDLVRFWNGKDYSLQLTPLIYWKGYVQLNKKEIKQLMKVLQNAFDLKKYPNE